MSSIDTLPLGVVCAADVEPEECDFISCPFIAKGELNLLCGNGGLGKSSFVTALVANYSNGKDIGGGKIAKKLKILICSAEDRFDGMIKRRLDDAEANQKNIFMFNETDPLVDLKDPRIEQIIVSQKIDLVVFDPITSYMGDANINKASDVRPVLDRLQQLAHRTKCAMLLIAHMNKSNKNKCIDKVAGSKVFVDCPRVVNILCEDPYKEECRVIYNAKNNITQSGFMVSFTNRNGKIEQLKEANYQEYELLEGFVGRRSRKEFKYEKAKKWLREILEKGPVDVNELKNLIKSDCDFSYSLVETIKSEVGVQSRWNVEHTHHEWYIPTAKNKNLAKTTLN